MCNGKLCLSVTEDMKHNSIDLVNTCITIILGNFYSAIRGNMLPLGRFTSKEKQFLTDVQLQKNMFLVAAEI